MKTTVIMPAYKAERFIDEAIMSIIGQKGLGSDDTLRLIVVCDGCEGTYDIAKKHSSENVLVCLTEKNGGTYEAINLGLSLTDARSDFIGCCGADDIWHEDRLSETIALSKLDHGGMVAYACMQQTISESGIPKETKHTRRCNSGHFLYRSEVFKAAGMYRPWRCGADTEFWYRANQLNLKIKTVPKKLFMYRKHTNSLTMSPETTWGSPIRERVKTKIKELSKRQFKPIFQSHPVPKINKSSGLILNPADTFSPIFNLGNNEVSSED